MSDNYHQTRFSEDAKRDVLWRTLWRAYFSKHAPRDGCVLDLGCGYGQFINNVEARRRIAVDAWPGFAEHLDVGVEPIVGSVTDLSAIEDGAVDYAFASNLFEHLSQDDVKTTLRSLAPKLSSRGTLTVLQPNFAHAYREYFDDFTHVSIWTHISFADFLRANGYDVLDVRARFLPMTIKSRLPVSPFLIEAYLHSPIKPMGKQMLLTAQVRPSS